MIRKRLAVLFFFVVTAVASGQAHPPIPDALDAVKLDQRLDAQVPLDAEFIDDRGQAVRLGDYLNDRPVALILAYYRCPMLCTIVLNNAVSALKTTGLKTGQDYDFVVVSIDPRETPQLAAEKKKNYAEGFGVSSEGWHFLTGQERDIKRLADAIGYGYSYDEKSDQYAHPAAVILLTPGGRVARYFYGVDYLARDLRLGLVEASAGQIGKLADQILLRCFQYDAATGRYTLTVMTLLRWLAAAFVVMLGTILALLILGGRPRQGRAKGAKPAAS